MASRTEISTDKAPRPSGPYSQGIRAGDFVFLAGQGPFASDGSLIEGSFETQARQAFANLAAVALESGSSLAHAVRIGVYLRDMSNFECMNNVYRTFFADPFPARTTVQSALPGFEIEVDGILAAASPAANVTNTRRT